MKKILLTPLILTLALAALAADDKSDTAKPGLTPEQAEAKYTGVIDQRSQKIADVLGLSDTNTAAKVHDIIMNQYRSLNDWHNANDPKIKAAKHDQAVIAKINAPLKTLHDEYLARLARYLTPAQIETVKDKMTYDKVEFTFKGYCVQYPNLSETNKQAILKMLKEAREEAMDGGSAKEKTAVFQRYKGRINNYLSKQGIHPDKQKAADKADVGK
jgi:hypothetical protein